MLIDTNILIYAHDKISPQHTAVKKWWETAINTQQSIILPDIAIQGFIRITSNPRITTNPVSIQTATNIIDNLLEIPAVSGAGLTTSAWSIYKKFAHTLLLNTVLFTDAILASQAISLGVPIVTADTDFAIFPGLSTINPLQTAQ